MNAFDLAGDFIGGLCRLIGKVFDFSRNHGKSFACFTGARGFDRGVQGQKIGLICNLGNQLHDLAHFFCDFLQVAHFGLGGIGMFNSVMRNPRKLCDLG